MPDDEQPQEPRPANGPSGGREPPRKRVVTHSGPRARHPLEYQGNESLRPVTDAPESTAETGESHNGPQASPAAEPAARRLRPDLELREIRPGTRPGRQYVRTTRTQSTSFMRLGPGMLQATDRAVTPRTGFGRFMAGLRRRFIGSPLASSQLAHERLTKIKALAVFSSDALSSVAYATEEILVVLIAAGATGAINRDALQHVVPISVGIVVLLAIVAISYRQTIHAYPNGGGSYIVAHTELGIWPGLVAAASLMVDYILTVAVSISSGVQAVTSAVQGLHPYTVEIAIGALIFMVVVNLRGVKESGSIFAAPTYVFIGSILLMITVGIVKAVLGIHVPPQETAHQLAGTGASIGIFLILRAFASGCTAMTGVEAISNGVPAFEKPESDNARTTLTWMAVILGVMFMGISVLANHFAIVPDDPAQRGAQTVLSKLAHVAFGGGSNPLYIITQAATFLILVLAANTSFADFPRLSSILSHDGYMPHQFAFRGDRLAFSNGIIVLGVVSGLLILLFKANTDALIPLYAVGVFISFTLSQSGMVRHWVKARREGGAAAGNAMRSMYINGTGAVATGIVAIVIAVTKFVHGAYIVIILIPIIVMILRSIGRHYQAVERELRIPEDDLLKITLKPPTQQTIIVPVGSINRAIVPTLEYARSISGDVTAVHITDNLEDAERLRHRWEEWAPDIPLLIIESPYRSFAEPLLAYIDLVSQQRGADHMVTVIVPEFVPEHLYQHLLHGQTALRLKAALLYRPNTVVADVPTHLGKRGAGRNGRQP